MLYQLAILTKALLTHLCLHGRHQNPFSQAFTETNSTSTVSSKTYGPPPFPCLVNHAMIQLVFHDQQELQLVLTLKAVGLNGEHGAFAATMR